MPFKSKLKKYEYLKKWQSENRDKCKEYCKRYDTNNPKKRKAQWKKYRLNNRDKLRERNKQYDIKNKDTRKQHRVETRDKIRERGRLWRLNNKDKRNEYLRKLSKNNLNYRLTKLLRRRIQIAIKTAKKSKRTMELIGCSTKYLLNHLESQFDDEMNWDKFMNGEIHIDHIRPCISFDLSNEEEQKICFHYSNLQPLWAIDNLMKGGRT